MTTLLEKTFYLLAPHDCMLCGSEGNILCSACRYELINYDAARCHVCQLPSSSYIPCASCHKKTALDGLFVLGKHENELREIVSKLKFNGVRQVAEDIAPTLVELLPLLPDETLVTHLPTAPKRIRMRGFDQASLLARAVAKEIKLPYTSLFQRSSNLRQVGARKAERLKQAKEIFRLASTKVIKGSTILLVDDVVTTGASIEAAATILKRAGAEAVYAVAIARRIG